jgi:hypothetical protein
VGGVCSDKPFPRMFFVFHGLPALFWSASTGQDSQAGSATKNARGNTHNTGTRGSINARCCMLRNRSLNKLPSGYPPRQQPRKNGVTVASRTLDRMQKAHTWSPRRLSLSSSPSCTSTPPSRTTCLPSRCPARPPCARRASCLPRRSLAACSRPASVLSAALRRILAESTDACSRFRKLRSKRARF